MRKFSKKQYLVAGAAALVVAAGTGTAFAYWTSSGSGTGTATTATSNTSLTVNQVSVPVDMAPGIAPEAITFTVTNNSSTQSAFVTNVTISIASVTAGPIAATHTCDATDYVLTQPTWTGVELAHGATSSSNATATLGFADNASLNQNNCQGAVVHLAYTAS